MKVEKVGVVEKGTEQTRRTAEGPALARAPMALRASSCPSACTYAPLSSQKSSNPLSIQDTIYQHPKPLRDTQDTTMALKFLPAFSIHVLVLLVLPVLSFLELLNGTKATTLRDDGVSEGTWSSPLEPPPSCDPSLFSQILTWTISASAWVLPAWATTIALGRALQLYGQVDRRGVLYMQHWRRVEKKVGSGLVHARLNDRRGFCVSEALLHTRKGWTDEVALQPPSGTSVGLLVLWSFWLTVSCSFLVNLVTVEGGF